MLRPYPSYFSTGIEAFGVCMSARIGYSSQRTQVCADVAQLVEHHLAKVRVAGSNPVVRSEGWHALAAEWPSGLGKGLQSPVHGFDSRLRLPYLGLPLARGRADARPDQAGLV